MRTEIFELTTDYIELIKLLKFVGVCDSGADAKEWVYLGNVVVNEKVEYRKRYKVRSGDIIIADGCKIIVIEK